MRCLASAAALLAIACGSGADAPGGGGGAGGAGGAAGAGGGAGAPSDPWPALLSETGLFADIAAGTVADDVQPFTPRYQLWSDGAEKRRWLHLPPGGTIDTSDILGFAGQDYWRYPVGTRVWKEFTRDGVRVETRLLEKTAERWLMVAYQWRSDGSDADAVPDGVIDASGTGHDIPAAEACARCHLGMADTLLGVSALQLDHDGPGVTLTSLVADGHLTTPPPTRLTVPGDATTQAALGYLHANCGHCHNPASVTYDRIKLAFWLEAAHLGTPEETSTWRTAVAQASASGPPRVIPGDAAGSNVILRMGSSDPLRRMPPLATELLDATGLATVSQWIDALPVTP